MCCTEIIWGGRHSFRAVLCRDGGVVYETSDHNPDVPEEEERIVAAGGEVHTTPSKHKVITDIGECMCSI